MTPTPEQWEQRFDEAKRNFELYGPLGMGIAYPKLKEFISQELQLQSSQLLSEVEAIISSNPQDFKDMTPGETKSLNNKQ